MPEQVEAVVIGGGQAGLAISYYLTQEGRSHVVLEQAAEIAPTWRHQRWDSFTLVTPNWTVQLPGYPYQGCDPDGFMRRADVVRHLEQYAASFQAPVRCGVQVTAVDPTPDGQSYRVATQDGASYAAATVVVATGSFQFPKPSSFSRNLPKGVLQLHSSHYRNPSALRSGAVLIVGSADTGCQLAEELNESGRHVYLCVGRALRRPRRYRGKDAMFWSVTRRMIEETQFASPGDRFGPNPQLTGKNGGHTIGRSGTQAASGMVVRGHDRLGSP